MYIILNRRFFIGILAILMFGIFQSCKSPTGSGSGSTSVSGLTITANYYGSASASFGIDLPIEIGGVACGVVLSDGSTQQDFQGSAVLTVTSGFNMSSYSTGTANIQLSGLHQGNYTATAYVKWNGNTTTYSSPVSFTELNDFSPWVLVASPPPHFSPDFSFSSEGTSFFGMRDSGRTTILEYSGAKNTWSVVSRWPYDYYSVVMIGQRCYAVGNTHFLVFDPLSSTFNNLLTDTIHAAYPKFCFSDGTSFYGAFAYSTFTVDTAINLWRYSPSTSQWQRLKDPPFGTSYASILGGNVQGKPDAFLSDTIWQYDPKQDSWTMRVVNNVPAPGITASLGADTSSFHFQCWRTIYAFMPSDMTWRKLTDFPTPLGSSFAFQDGGRNFFMWDLDTYGNVTHIWKYSL